MTEKQVFTKDNLSALLRLQADALDRGEVLEFEEGEILCFCFEKDNKNIAVMGTGFCHFYTSITLKPKPQLRVMTAEELNDIYWEFGKDFRYRINSLAPIFGFYNYSLGTKIESNEQYSTDRGKTWNKCEVVE